MKNLLSASVSALVLAAGTGLAVAQTSAGGDMMSGVHASELTCAEFAGLDSETAPRMLYFVSGYLAGQNAGASQDAASADMEIAPSSPAAGATAGTAQEDMNDTASAELEQPAASGADLTASSSPDTDSDAAGVDQTTTAAISGFNSLDVDEVLAACRQNPDTRVSDQLGLAGTTN
jgi:hypothetical protein